MSKGLNTYNLIFPRFISHISLTIFMLRDYYVAVQVEIAKRSRTTTLDAIWLGAA